MKIIFYFLISWAFSTTVLAQYVDESKTTSIRAVNGMLVEVSKMELVRAYFNFLPDVYSHSKGIEPESTGVVKVIEPVHWYGRVKQRIVCHNLGLEDPCKYLGFKKKKARVCEWLHGPDVARFLTSEGKPGKIRTVKKGSKIRVVKSVSCTES